MVKMVEMEVKVESNLAMSINQQESTVKLLNLTGTWINW